MVLGYILAALFDFADEQFSVLEVDDSHDNARRHDEVKQRDDHVEARVEEPPGRIVQRYVWRVVRRYHHQQAVQDPAIG